MLVLCLYSEFCWDSVLSCIFSCGLVRKLFGLRFIVWVLCCSRWLSRVVVGCCVLFSLLRLMCGVFLLMFMCISGLCIIVVIIFFLKKLRICDMYCCFCGFSYCFGGIVSSIRIFVNGMCCFRWNCLVYLLILGMLLWVKLLMCLLMWWYSFCCECCNRLCVVFVLNRCILVLWVRLVVFLMIVLVVWNWLMLVLSRMIRFFLVIIWCLVRVSRLGCLVFGRRCWCFCYCVVRCVCEVDSR